MSDRRRALLVANGALVFLIGMAAGFPFAFVLLEKIALWPFPEIHWRVPGDVRGWRMAHLEGILNGLMLFAVAAAGRHLVLSARAQTILFWSLVITAWGNIVASVIGPVLGGRGLEFGGGVANSLMFLFFMAAIVTVIIAMVLVFRGALRAARRVPE
jgi:hypothetical protein